MKYIVKIMIILLFVPSLAQSEVTINVDKINKHIEFTVCNNVKKRQIVYAGIIAEKKEHGKWIFIRGNIDCPCSAKCRRVPIELELGECKTHRWDKKKARCEAVENGTYRLVIIGNRDSNTNMNNIIGKSLEFKLY